MDYLISLLVLLPCARAGSPGAVGQLIPFRRNAYTVYAADGSSEEYEPYAVAALPLHAPVPVLQLLSSAPAPRPRARRPARRPRPEPDLYAYDTAHVEHAYEPVRYESVGYEPVRYESVGYEPVRHESVRHESVGYEPVRHESVGYERVYPERDAPPKHSKARDPYEDEASSLVVYARPNKHGGFSYRKPTAVTPAPRQREPQEPVIIRIHKYKVIH